ncbi:MAG TPA: GNAT family N-acetyltransferase [Acidimicrobiia bacterium]|nr:GNAT family N-acetyltransferase [Acidimicrobiia bacterium]
MISRARLEDLDVLAALSAEFNEIDGHPHDDTRVRAALSPLLADDSLGVVYVFGELASGYAVVTWGYSIESGGRDALLDEIYVRPRGQGLGGAAFEEVLDDLRQRGLTRMFLETERPNTKVRTFYTRHGFKEDDSIWMSREL